jgi:alkylation response protein AidB-like acyl-CoA dehydrogenase
MDFTVSEKMKNIPAFYYRHERADRIYDGADEVYKISVAKRILKEYEGKKIR